MEVVIGTVTGSGGDAARGGIDGGVPTLGGTMIGCLMEKVPGGGNDPESEREAGIGVVGMGVVGVVGIGVVVIGVVGAEAGGGG